MKLKNLFIIIIFLLPLVVYGQDRIYIDQYGDKTKLKSNAVAYRLTSRDSTVNEGKIVREYYLSGKLKSECHLAAEQNEKLKTKKDVWEGTFRMWYESGQLKRDIDYHKNKIDGHLTTYWENGKVKRHELFQEDKSVEGKCYDENGLETTYYPFYKMPGFRGGVNGLLEFISKNMKYCVDAQEAGIQGKVVVQFVIDKKGQVNNINIKQSLYRSLDFEAQRIVSILPRWIPCETDGEVTTVWYALPINFHLK